MGFEDQIVIAGPSFSVELPTIDACHPVHYSRRLLIFRCTSTAQRDEQLKIFKVGLEKLILKCPILGGIVVPLPSKEVSNGKEGWRTFMPDKGVELITKDLSAKMPSFKELEATNFLSLDLPYDLLVPIPEHLDDKSPFVACKVQVSAINGGTIVTFSMSHSVGDGAANNELMRVLCEEMKLAKNHSIEGIRNEERTASATTGMGLDRTVMRNMTCELPFNIKDHPGYMLRSSHSVDMLSPEQLVAESFKATNPEIPILFSISPANLAQLKADATLPGGLPISTHDALSALMWRSVLLIRSRRAIVEQNVLNSIIGDLFMPSDARRHLKIPTSYIGNVVYQLKVTLELGTLFSPSGLKYAASAVRRAITAVNPTIVASYVAETRERWIDWSFLSTMSTTGLAMGTDWTSSEVYTQDWGQAFGPLVRYRYSNQPSNCIMPKLPDGGAELMVSVMPEEVEMLKSTECFGKYI